MSRVCVIPARGGSVRIPRKNVREFRGQPMLLYPIRAAQASGLFERIIVSTDDDEIALAAAALGCAVHRRTQDDGERGTQDVVVEVLEHQVGLADAVVCTIYPCSPMLTSWALQDAMDVYEAGGAEHLVSTIPGTVQDAGCFYIQEAAALLDGDRLWSDVTIAYPLSNAIDINTPEDWARAEAMFDALHGA